MFGLILIFILVWIALIATMAVVTLSVQSYFNEQPPTIKDLFWRAPAAGTILMGFVLLWCHLASKSPEAFADFLEMNATEEQAPYSDIWIAPFNPVTKEYLTAEKHQNQWQHYRLQRTANGDIEYRDNLNRVMPGRPDSIVVREDKEFIQFLPERNEEGKFQPRSTTGLRYIHKDSERFMEEGELGRVSIFHTGQWVVYLLFNILHGVIWFGCFWLLMRFSWTQAFGLALLFWLVMTLLVVPPLLDRTVKSTQTTPAIDNPFRPQAQ